MDVIEVLREAVGNCGTSASRVALSLGVTPQRLTNLWRQDDAKVSMAVQVANACGYRVVLVPDGADLPDGSMEVTE